jgi:CDP-glucose 4,6-dehydratase
VIDPQFWRDRRVFLTGHTGFKGSWLSLWLQRLGAHLTGFSIAVPTQPSFFEAAKLAEGLLDRRGDVRDRAALAKALMEAAPEIVIHAAAQPQVITSYADPIGTIHTNVMGTAHLLDAARQCPSVKAILIVTSDKCYENREWVWGYRETDPMGGYDPYSASKAAAELITASMRRAYFHPDAYERHRVAVASARAGNVIGGGDWSAYRILPDLMCAFARGVPATVRNPKAIRPWQFVLDPLSGYLLLCERLYRDGAAWAEAWNFGPDLRSDRPVAELAETAVRLWGAGAAINYAESSGPHEAFYLRLDASKAQIKLGWRPRVDFEQAMQMSTAWYRAYYGGENIRALAEAQLQAWLSMA